MTLNKPPFLASACTALGLIILCGLGTWQANKYIVKTSDMNSAACQQEKLVVLDNNFDHIGAIRGQLCRDRITVSGQIDAKNVIPLGPRVHEGDVGYHLYTALKGEDGSSILVNLGWSEVSSLEIESTKASINGVIIKPSGRNSFTPDNNLEKNEWFYIDTLQAAQHWNMNDLSPYVLFAQDIQPKLIEPFTPAELSKTYLTPQTHLQYAAFWYFMALAMLAVFILRFAVKKND